MSLLDFIEDVNEREKTLTVFTAKEDEQLFGELAEFFEVQNITVRRGEVEEGGPQNFVVLHQEGDAVAVSTLQDVRDSLFLGGSSPQFPGELRLTEGNAPDVLSSLGNTTFTARDEDRYLIAGISHYIEEIAWRARGGTIHSGFGTLSALRDDAASYGIYTKLDEAGVDVHVYGESDAEFPDGTGFAIHSEDTEEVRQSRFVVFDGAGDPTDKAAMVATEEERNSYRGFWTFDGEFVDEILAYLDRTYVQSGRG